MAYATIEDLEQRWRPLEGAEKMRAQVLLDDAAVYIDTALGCSAEQPMESALTIVSCNMVIRSMLAADRGAFGVSSESMKADIYSHSWEYANPNGDLYLTAQEKKLLGVTSSYLTTVRPSITPVKVVRHGDIWRDR